VFKITNSKHQISNKRLPLQGTSGQVSNSNIQFSRRSQKATMAKSADQNLSRRDIVWVFEFRSLKIVCNL